MSSREREWSHYLDAFHALRPGITEELLERCSAADGANPYQWLTDGLNRDAQVVDLACGSGPTRPLVGDRWVGIDRSKPELVCARTHGREGLIRGDAIRVSIRDATADAVLCSMALMLIDPCSAALGEINRILTPVGELRILLPATTPLTISDRWNYLTLFAATRSVPRFPPTPLRRKAEQTFGAAGLIIISDQSRRFGCPIRTNADADHFVDSWYRPNLPAGATDRKPRHRRSLSSTTIGVPLRRIIARKSERLERPGRVSR